MHAAISRGIDTIKWRSLRNVARWSIENVRWGGDVDVESGGGGVPFVSGLWIRPSRDKGNGVRVERGREAEQRGPQGRG